MSASRIIRTSDIMRCPKHSLSPSHYRDDGTCECKPRRELWAVAAEITVKWRYRPAAAEPHLTAMGAMRTMDDTYPDGAERPSPVRFAQVSGRDAVRSFLEVSEDWHGPDARKIKAELRAMLR